MVTVMLVSCASPAQPTGGSTQGGTGNTTPPKEQVFRQPTTPIRTLDPGLSTDNVSDEFITKLFDALVELKDDGTIGPALAEKWEVSTDAKMFTFTIRNAKWSDGKPIVAGDFEYAIKRVLDPKTASEYANTLWPIKGAKKFNAENGTAADVAVKAKDDKTLTIESEDPAAYLLTILTTWTTFAVRKDVIDKFGDKWTDPANIVTSGPFKLQEMVADQRAVMVRNDDYWGTKPKLSRVEWRIFPDSNDVDNQILRAYENDELDSTGSHDMPASEVDRVLKDSKLASQVKIFDQSRSSWVCVNNAKAPFNDVRVRKALGMALERDKLINNVLKSPFKVGDDIVPPGIVGRNPSSWPKESVTDAKKLLADAGYADGKGFPEFTYVYNSATSNKAVGEYLQGRWKDTLGINLKLDQMEFAQFIPFRRGNKTYDTSRCSWGSDYEDPYNWYNTLFSSTADQLQQTTNWKNTDFDNLVAKAAGTSNPADRKKLYEQADDLLGKDYFSIPLFYGTLRVLVKPNVENYKLTRVLGFSNLREVSINK